MVLLVWINSLAKQATRVATIKMIIKKTAAQLPVIVTAAAMQLFGRTGPLVVRRTVQSLRTVKVKKCVVMVAAWIHFMKRAMMEIQSQLMIAVPIV